VNKIEIDPVIFNVNNDIILFYHSLDFIMRNRRCIDLMFNILDFGLFHIGSLFLSDKLVNKSLTEINKIFS
jgi:hypothetical protein